MADGDLISRASLLAAVAELRESPWYNFGKVDGASPEGVAAMWYYGYLQRKEAVEIIEDMCIKKEPAVLADSGWISVDDRLPEPETWVLVFARQGSYTNLKVDYITRDGIWLKSVCVTHWQPLPEPPKGE